MGGLRRLAAAWRRARERRWVRWGQDALVLALAVAAISAYQTRGHLSDVPAPPLSLLTLSGEPASLAALRGKPALVAFWAPWCQVCKAESQNLSWAMRLAGRRAHVVSIAAGYDEVAEVRGYVQERDVDYPVWLGDEAAARAFRVEAFPTVYFLDPSGRVKHSAVGYTTTLGLLVRLFL